jgi:hypothetical protein
VGGVLVPSCLLQAVNQRNEQETEQHNLAPAAALSLVVLPPVCERLLGLWCKPLWLLLRLLCDWCGAAARRRRRCC